MLLCSYFLCSLVCACGMAIVLVEKRFEFPVRWWNVQLKLLVHHTFSPPRRSKIKKLFACAVCMAFWTSFVSDIYFCIASNFHYFLWPISGFASAGIVWFAMSLLEAIDHGKS
jgi:hypothetical protein